MALTVNQAKHIERMNPLLSIVCKQRKEQWAGDKCVFYKIEEGDARIFEEEGLEFVGKKKTTVVEATPVKTFDLDSATFDKGMGYVNPKDTLENTGFHFDAKIESGKVDVSLMIHTSGSTKKAIFVQSENLNRVKPLKGEHYVLGVRSDCTIIYNSTRTIGVSAIEDDKVVEILDKYDPLFKALDFMRKFNGTMEIV